jgi:hypothetical protein
MWAMGLIFYQMVSGYMPFDIQFQSIIGDEPKSLPSFVPESVKTMILIMLSKKPELRPLCEEVIDWIAKEIMPLSSDAAAKPVCVELPAIPQSIPPQTH